MYLRPCETCIRICARSEIPSPVCFFRFSLMTSPKLPPVPTYKCYTPSPAHVQSSSIIYLYSAICIYMCKSISIFESMWTRNATINLLSKNKTQFCYSVTIISRCYTNILYGFTQNMGGKIARLIDELRFYIHLTQNRTFRRHSSQPIAWLSTEKLNQTCIGNKIYCNIKSTQKTKAGFCRLL